MNEENNVNNNNVINNNNVVNNLNNNINMNNTNTVSNETDDIKGKIKKAIILDIFWGIVLIIQIGVYFYEVKRGYDIEWTPTCREVFDCVKIDEESASCKFCKGFDKNNECIEIDMICPLELLGDIDE